jgi:hypothetical protein
MSFVRARGHCPQTPLTRGPEAYMKLLLTSGGVTNASIHSALVRLLGKPVTESRAPCVNGQFVVPAGGRVEVPTLRG